MSRSPRSSTRRASGSGGAYALAGFAYQLLGTLDYAASVVVLETTGDALDPSDLTMTLEPAAGGDAVHGGAGRKDVIQFKRRSRPITDAVVLSEVLPDLVRAFDPEVDRYVLRTNTVLNLSPRLRAFLDQVRSLGLEAGILAAEAEGVRFKAGRKTLAPRPFLSWLLSRVRMDPPAPDETARLASVLARLVLESDEEVNIEERVLGALTLVSPDPAAARQLWMTLMGQLLDLARRGDQTWTVAELFEACGLPVGALVSTVQVVARLQAGLGSALTRLRYQIGRDGRSLPLAACGARPVAFTGPSGVGKTWALARAAHEAAAQGAVVIWIEQPPGAIHELAQMIASRLQAARGHVQAVIGDGVATLMRTISGRGTRLRLCVCLDRFAGPQAVTDILTASWWSEQGVEVIAALPAADPDAISLGEAVTLVPVPEFGQRELRRVLTAAGVRWAGLADDVRDLLRRPSLASLYIGLNRPEFQPEDEYVLMDAAWNRVPVGDAAAWRRAHDVIERRLDQMAEAILGGQRSEYPWRPDSDPAFTADQIERLERHGFLRWSAVDRISLDHDRLLAWGLAGAMARRLRSGRVSVTDLAALLEAWGSGSDDPPILPRHATGYAPMDLLWMLTPPSGSLDPVVDALVRALHPGRRHLEWGAIASMGARSQVIGVAAAVHWPIDTRWHPSGVASALKGPAGSILPEPVVQAMLGLLNGQDADRRALAVTVFKARPDQRALWPLIRAHAAVDLSDAAIGAYTSQEINRAHSAYDAALEIVVAFPGALLKVARRKLSPRQLRTVSWLCSELPPSAIRRVWQAIGPRVAETLDSEVRRRANKRLLAIMDTDLLADSFGSADDDGFLWDAQACVDPDAALARLEAADPTLFDAGVAHFGVLVRQRPEAQAFLVEALRQGRLQSKQLAGSVFDWSALVSHETWTALIAARGSDWLSECAGSVLRRISDGLSLPLLDALGELRGGPVEVELEVCARLELEAHVGRSAGPHLGPASEVLLRIGGDGFERLTTLRLRSANPIEVREGVRDVLLTTSPEPIAALIDCLESAFAGGKSVDLSPLKALALIDPAAATALGHRWLAMRTTLGGLAAGEIARLTADRDLAQGALDDLARRRGEVVVLARTRLLTEFRLEDAALRRIADRHLKAGTSKGRAWALWIAERTGDLSLRNRVAEAVLPHISRADRDDAATLGALCEDPAFASRLHEALKASRGGRSMRLLLAELPSSMTLAGDELLADQAIGDALRFEDKFLNTPREGQERLWALDPEIAFEIFHEGLRRGGRVSERLAFGAVRADEALAVPILLEGLTTVSKADLRDELTQALRLCSNVSAVEAAVLKMIEDETAIRRLAGLQAAGWLATEALMEAVLQVIRTDPRSRIYAAASEAIERAEALRSMQDVAVRASTAAPALHRRLVAVLAGGPMAVVLRDPDDPVRRALGELDPHAFEILRSRFKR